jgi:hypothetical protein
MVAENLDTIEISFRNPLRDEYPKMLALRAFPTNQIPVFDRSDNVTGIDFSLILSLFLLRRDCVAKLESRVDEITDITPAPLR